MPPETTPPEDAIFIDPEQVCFIIITAKELDAKVEPDDPGSGSNPANDNEIDIVEDLADDLTLAELAWRRPSRYHRAFVEGDLKLEAELGDSVQNLLVRSPGGDDRAPD
jgi:hypothetical protein